MFNVNHFLVSQTNPHIAPVLNLKKMFNTTLMDIVEAEFKHRSASSCSSWGYNSSVISTTCQGHYDRLKFWNVVRPRQGLRLYSTRMSYMSAMIGASAGRASTGQRAGTRYVSLCCIWFCEEAINLLSVPGFWLTRRQIHMKCSFYLFWWFCCRCEQLVILIPSLRILRCFSQRWEGDVTFVPPPSALTHIPIANLSSSDLLEVVQQVRQRLLLQA